MQKKKMWTKNRHGGLPVYVYEGEGKRREFELECVDGSKKRFKSFRGLMLHLEGRAVWSYERYFRVGKYARRGRGDRVGITIMEIFRKRRPQGIDLSKRGHEVAKILFAGYGSRINYLGHDPDDVLQEVYQGILIRNQGKSPWDASRGSFGTYVHMVCGCVLSNYSKKRGRYLKNEQVGVLEWREGESREVDLGESETLVKDKGACVGAGERVEEYVEDLCDWIRKEKGERGEFLCRVVPYCVYLGMRRGEIAEEVGESPSKVGKALSEIRDLVREWHGRSRV